MCWECPKGRVKPLFWGYIRKFSSTSWFYLQWTTDLGLNLASLTLLEPQSYTPREEICNFLIVTEFSPVFKIQCENVRAICFHSKHLTQPWWCITSVGESDEVFFGLIVCVVRCYWRVIGDCDTTLHTKVRMLLEWQPQPVVTCFTESHEAKRQGWMKTPVSPDNNPCQLDHISVPSY